MISASAVKELREISGAGMMDCKKALQEADGDIKKAMEVLRKNGIAKISTICDAYVAWSDIYIARRLNILDPL